ncbi:MAG: hypothetical protein M3R04_01990 [bacterium]|nr:hypothetical protein [bacterium]
MPQEFTLAITVIPLLCLYIGLIAWLTFDASQDSNWFVWLLLFAVAGPVTIPLYIVTSRMARRTTPQDVLDARADQHKHSPFAFSNEIDRTKWLEEQDPTKGTMYEPSLGLSLRSDRHEKYADPFAEQLFDAGDEAAAFRYLAGMYMIATEQGDQQRQAGLRALIDTRIGNGHARLGHWVNTGEDLPMSEIPALPATKADVDVPQHSKPGVGIQPPRRPEPGPVKDRSAPF